MAISTGIARVEVESGDAKRLPQPDSVVTGAIDGLYWYDGALFGIQNFTNPGRVVRIALRDGGTRVVGVDVLQSHRHPAFDEPTTGTIVGDRLYVLANSFVGRYRSDGTIEDPATMKAPVVVAVPLRGSGQAQRAPTLP